MLRLFRHHPQDIQNCMFQSKRRSFFAVFLTVRRAMGRRRFGSKVGPSFGGSFSEALPTFGSLAGCNVVWQVRKAAGLLWPTEVGKMVVPKVLSKPWPIDGFSLQGSNPWIRRILPGVESNKQALSKIHDVWCEGDLLDKSTMSSRWPLWKCLGQDGWIELWASRLRSQYVFEGAMEVWMTQVMLLSEAFRKRPSRAETWNTRCRGTEMRVMNGWSSWFGGPWICFFKIQLLKLQVHIVSDGTSDWFRWWVGLSDWSVLHWVGQRLEVQHYLGGGNSNIYFFSPLLEEIWGNDPIFTINIIFRMGWNHHLVTFKVQCRKDWMDCHQWQRGRR